MIHITFSDLEKLQRIGSGRFGTVYKKDDKTAYKIYHPTVANLMGTEQDNPTISIPITHYKLLLNRSKKLKYTDGINDLIRINGKIHGVEVNYYNGTTLSKVMNKPIDEKIELSKQIIKKAKELTHYYIYPTDYKLNNMMLEDNEVKLIDLDDQRTHEFLIPSFLFRAMSINALGETIQDFLKLYEHLNVPMDAAKETKREKAFYSFLYKRIEKYIKIMAMKKNIIYIDKETDINKLKEIMTHNDFEIVYSIEEKLEKNKYLEIINNLKKENLQLYDFILSNKIDNYKEIESINEEYILNNKELKKLK